MGTLPPGLGPRRAECCRCTSLSQQVTKLDELGRCVCVCVAFVLTRNVVFASNAYVAVENSASDKHFSGKSTDLQTSAFLSISPMV